MTDRPRHLITPDDAKTLDGLFYARVQRTPDQLAYRHYDESCDMWRDLSWADMSRQVARWQAALAGEELQRGDRVAVIMQNCPEWAMFDQAALANGLVVVPLYAQDRAENIAYILQDAGVKLLLLGGQEHWDSIQPVVDQLGFLTSIITVWHIDTATHRDVRLKTVGEWLPDRAELMPSSWDKNSLASIVYTSGTTGRPKGVMLSHDNILSNAYASLQLVSCASDEIFLSFLPLSHTLERTAGYYLPMMAGAAVAYNRSIPQLADDLIAVRPTIMIAVPRIFERIYNKIQSGLTEKSSLARALFNISVDIGWHRFEHQQKRASWHPKLLFWPLFNLLVAQKVLKKLGGRMNLAVVGGAPLPFDVARLFLALGLPMIQGYGLTETSPVISVNPIKNNDPKGVGVMLNGIEAQISERGELLVRGPGVMLGYWANETATGDMIDADGWLHTGDKARIDGGQLYITGRLKEIIVLSNGEKIPPADMETTIAGDPLFEQVLLVGDGRPFLSALAVLNPELLLTLAEQAGLDPDTENACNSARIKEMVLEKIATQISSFPGYARIHAVHCTIDPWTIEDGLVTPTLKLKRETIVHRFEAAITEMYRNH